MARTKPADGERGAIMGYFSQYTVSANIVLKALVERRLEWIRVADPDAGRVDDFQIGTSNRIDAYQIKWSTYPRAMTWSQLTKGDEEKISLIRQLADGWKHLQSQYPGSRVVVHLVTNNYPSSNDTLPIDAKGGTSKHLATFLTEAWNVWRKDTTSPIESIGSSWSYTMDQLQKETGLSSDEFSQFVSNCELDFGISLPSKNTIFTRDQAAAVRDIEHIRSRLFATVALPAKLVELKKIQLLDILGWKDHLRLKRKHDFPVENDLYRPIEETLSLVEQAIETLPGGYLAILGGPGSGKSTLLTHLLRYRSERVIRYYAFIPGEGESLKPRGESENFLHDLVCQIADTGFSAGDSMSLLTDRLSLLDTLRQQLNALGEAYANTGNKTLILVDGLDHVPREYNPDRSFLRDLPLPSEIPEGVLFVLGSQTDELDDLPVQVRESIRCPNRSIEVAGLSKASVNEITDQALPDHDITVKQKEEIFHLCAGHPLSLRYLLNRLADSQNLDIALQDTQQFESDVNASYASCWSLVRDGDAEVVELLGLLCRMREPIDMDWVKIWAGDNVIRRVKHTAGHYFHRDDGVYWSFFHSSFRTYIRHESTRSGLGQYEKAIDSAFHAQLAKIFAEHGNVERHKLDELHHYAMQGDDTAVLQLSQQRFFRNLAFAGIPMNHVIDGIHLGVKAAAHAQNGLALIRMAFALKEAQHRYEEQDEAAIIEILIHLGDYRSAIEHICDGYRLIVPNSTALDSSREFLRAGLNREARFIFNLAEPTDVLTRHVHTDIIQPYYDKETLESWAAAAVHFQRTSTVLDLIDQLKTDSPPEHAKFSAEEFLCEIRNCMKLEVGEELLNAEKWDEFCSVRDTFNPEDEEDYPYWIRLMINGIWAAHFGKNNDNAKTELALLIKKITPDLCHDQIRTAIAECIICVSGNVDLARKWIVGLPQPSLVEPYSHTGSELTPWTQRIRLNSLLYALDNSHPTPHDLILDADSDSTTGSILFERSLCQLARIRGRRWRGEPLSTVDVAQEVLGLVRLYYHDICDTRSWHGWVHIQHVRNAFYKEIMAELSHHDSGCLEQLMSLFEQEWTGPKSQYWPTDVIRSIVLEALDLGQPLYWVIRHLTNLENRIDTMDVNGKVQHYGEQAKAWLAVEKFENVRVCIQRMQECAIGVGYAKDYQTTVWISRLREYLAQQPDEAWRLLPWMARAVVTIEDSTERATQEAARELVEVAFEITPRNAVRLSNWFSEQRIGRWHLAGLEAIISAATSSQIKSPDLVIAIAAYLYLPQATHVSHEDVPKHLGKYLLDCLPIEKALKTFDSVVGKCDVLSLEIARTSWRQGFNVALEETGRLGRYKLPDTENDTEGMSPGGSDNLLPTTALKLNNGETLSVNEVKQKCEKFAGVIELLEESSGEVYGFIWDSVVRPALASFERSQLLTLVLHLRAKGMTEFLIEIGCHFHHIGDDDMARELAEEVINTLSWYDSEWRGWSSSSAFKLLRDVDRDYARGIAFDSIARDMIGNYHVGHEIATKIPSVLQFLEIEISPDSLWAEIEDHMKALYSEQDIQRISTPDLDSSIDNDTPCQALVDLLMTHVVYPCNEVRRGAMRGLRLAVESGCEEAIATVGQALSEDMECQWILIQLVEALSVSSLEAVQPWQSQLVALTGHSNYAIRKMANGICQRRGWDSIPPPSGFELPAIYQMWIPDDATGAPIVDGPPIIGHVSPDTDNPSLLIRPFHVDAELLAKAAGVEPNAVFTRMAQLMRTIKPFEMWSSEAEKRLMDEMKTSGLEFSYNRPRAIVARRALFHVASELADAGLLSRANLSDFFRYTRPHDPTMLFQHGLPRPEEISLPPEREYPMTVDEWRCKGDLNQCSRQIGGLIVVAEDSHFKSLGDDRLKERRQSILTPMNWVDDFKSRDVGLWKRLHEELIGGTISNYQELNKFPPYHVIGNRLDGCNSPGCNWLATNPLMARDFGWQIKEEGWFSWVDEEGNTMMKSLWWQDGLLARTSRVLHCWVAEGWVVLSSRKALSQIESQLGTLDRVSYVTRAASQDDRGHTKTDVEKFSS